MTLKWIDAIGQEINLDDKIIYYYSGGSRAYGSIRTVWALDITSDGEPFIRAHRGNTINKNDGRITNLDNCVVLKREHFPQLYEEGE